jgi:hypothetical protein
MFDLIHDSLVESPSRLENNALSHGPLVKNLNKIHIFDAGWAVSLKGGLTISLPWISEDLMHWRQFKPVWCGSQFEIV